MKQPNLGVLVLVGAALFAFAGTGCSDDDTGPAACNKVGVKLPVNIAANLAILKNQSFVFSSGAAFAASSTNAAFYGGSTTVKVTNVTGTKVDAQITSTGGMVTTTCDFGVAPVKCTSSDPNGVLTFAGGRISIKADAVPGKGTVIVDVIGANATSTSSSAAVSVDVTSGAGSKLTVNGLATSVTVSCNNLDGGSSTVVAPPTTISGSK